MMGDMCRLEGGDFLMGSERYYPEERPVRPACVKPFWIDVSPVTNAQFAQFIRDTGYRTAAERIAHGAPHPGSSVFVRPSGPVDLSDPGGWWQFIEGACWHAPLGKESSTAGLEHHPVVHVAFEDALAYASWCGKRLPSEAEWEYAARGGLDGADFAWGTHLEPEGRPLANYWQGAFPYENTLQDGWERTSPVGSFPGNGWGLLDMIGNVWEWTSDLWPAPPGSSGKKLSCCSGGLGDPPLQRVLKGGSHLCAANYCQRYRPAARHPQPQDETTSHIGFRCARDD